MFAFDAMTALPVWAMYTLAAWALGAWVLRSLTPVHAVNRLAQPALSLALGMGCFGTLWSCFALLPEALQPFSIALVLLISLLLGARSLNLYLRALSLRSLIPEKGAMRWIAALLLVLMALAPLMTWYPLGTDASSFYFAQAKLVAYSRHFVPLPGYESFAQIALPAELTYSALMLIGNEMAARLINASELWICVLLVAAIAQACRASTTGIWLSVLILLGSTSVTLLVADGKTDLYGAMLGLAAVYAFIAAPELTARHAVLMGLLSGFAVVAKLSFLPVLVPMLGMLLLWKALCGHNLSQGLRTAVAAGTVVALFVLLSVIPLVLKNWLSYGEPLAPFLFFGEGHGNNLFQQDWFSPENTRWILLTYPLVWLFGQYPMQHGVISPLLLAGLPALFMLRRGQIDWRHDMALVLAFAGVLGILTWAVIYPATVAPRYIFPALLALIPLGARGIETVWTSLEGSRWAHRCYTALLLAFALLPLSYHKSDVKYGLRWVENGPIRSNVDYIWQGLQVAESALPEGGRLFLVGWERSPLQPRTLSCLVGMDEVGGEKIAKGEVQPEQYWTDMYMAGVRVMLVNVSSRKDFVKVIDISRKPDWLDIGTQTINSYYTLYLLSPKSGAPLPLRKCAPSSRGVWEPTTNETTEHG